MKLGDPRALDIVGIGNITLAFDNGTNFMLENVRHVPDLAKSLISVGQLDNIGYYTTFGGQSYLIKKGNLVISKG